MNGERRADRVEGASAVGAPVSGADGRGEVQEATTRDALIAAATELFARRGFDGTSVRAITRAAGANLGAITYHFGTKAALYDAVVSRVVGSMTARVEAAVRGGGSALDRIEAAVRAHFAVMQGTPGLPDFVLQQLHPGRTPSPSVAVVLGRVVGVIAGVIREGQEAGEIREGDPVLLALSTASQVVHLAVGRRLLQAAVGVDQDDPEVRRRLVDHAVVFVRAGLEARGERGR